MKIPPKLQNFLWLVFQSKLMSNEQRYKRQLAMDSSCNFCGWGSESLIHIFRDCPRARWVWERILVPNIYSPFFLVEPQPWLLSNLLSKAKWKDNLSSSSVFVFTCWYLWKWRN